MSLFEAVYRFFGWWIINIDILFLLLLFIGGGLWLFHKKVWGKRLLLSGCLGFAFFGVIPVGLWTFEILENHFPKIQSIPPGTKGMILLGGSFDKMTTVARGETSYNLSGGKLFQFIQLSKKYPDLKLVFAGTPFEVDTTKKELIALGIDPNTVIYEGNSKDTKENAANTAALINPTPDEKWVLITSAYHLPRSVGLFRKVGFNVIPLPLDYHAPGKYEPWFFLGLTVNLQAWQASSREWLGMLANYLLGRSDEVYPRIN